MTIADAIRQAVEQDVANHVLDLIDLARFHDPQNPWASGWSFGGTKLMRTEEDGTVLELRVRVRDE